MPDEPSRPRPHRRVGDFRATSGNKASIHRSPDLASTLTAWDEPASEQDVKELLQYINENQRDLKPNA